MPHSVGILGNLNIDLVMGPMAHLPQFGREIVVPSMSTRAAGAAGNAAAALDRLGLTCMIAGAIGDDFWVDLIRRTFGSYPLVDLSHVETIEGTPTGLSLALVNAAGERGFVTITGALDCEDEAFLARHEATLLACRYLIICGYFFMPALCGDPMRRFLRRARKAGVQTLLDTGWDLDDWPEPTRSEVLRLLPEAGIFAPNLEEAQALTGRCTPEECATALLAAGAGAVALKLGPEGSLWADEHGIVRRAAARVTAFDTTGAGDSFNAALFYGFEQGWPVDRTLAFANAFCALVVSRRENRVPGVDEVMAFLGPG